jgi:hypothetical protein
VTASVLVVVLACSVAFYGSIFGGWSESDSCRAVYSVAVIAAYVCWRYSGCSVDLLPARADADLLGASSIWESG